MNAEEIHQTVNLQRDFFETHKTYDINWRLSQLSRLRDMIISHEDELTAALSEDLGRAPLEAYFCDIGSLILELNETMHGLRKWSKPETHFSGLHCFPSLITKVYKLPYGVTLIISPFNFPILLSLGVLVASIAGGNTAVIKTSSKSPNCTKLIKRLIAETFPPEYITVIDGGHDVADMCLNERFDKIFYTGSPRVGIHVLEEAAKNLTPVALELGGETGNWCVIRKDANIRDAARKIAFFKALNSGQICININQVAVASEVADEFVAQLKAEFIRQLGDDPVQNGEYPHMINESAYDKCDSIVKEYSDRVVFGGHGNRGYLKYAPTVLYPVDINDKVVQKELFCPILPVVTYKDDEIDSLLHTISVRERGLALYLFTRDIPWAKRTMQRMQYGGGCINEVCLHMMVKGVPFNGVGHSGMGAYHGEWGFKEFTHPSAVLIGSNHMNLPLREHPYESGIKSKLIRLFER